MWVKPNQVPEVGSRVRVTDFGDDHHRPGEVVGRVHGHLLIRFSPDREDRYHTTNVEVWEK